MAAYKGGKLPDGTPLNVAVYKAYRNAGLSHTQALAITAEVGRENGFNAGTLFGTHTDPAANGSGKAIRNMGMLSWNQGRDVQLERYLNQQGVMSGGRMLQTQANLNAQARFSVGEMRSPRYAGKLKRFWGNPNASPEAYAKELGKNYIVWAYGQDTIKAKGGGRQPFNWKAHDGYRRDYLNTLNGMLGGKESYTPQQGSEYQAQQAPPPDPRLSMSAPQLLKTLRQGKDKRTDIQLLYELSNNNGLAGREINSLLSQGHGLGDIAGQLGLKVPQAEPPAPIETTAETADDLPNFENGFEGFMATLGDSEPEPYEPDLPDFKDGFEGFMSTLEQNDIEPQGTGDAWQTQNRRLESTSPMKNERELQPLKSSWELPS